VLLGGAAGQLSPAGRFRWKLSEKASPFPQSVPTVTLRENLRSLYGRLDTFEFDLPLNDDIAGTALFSCSKSCALFRSLFFFYLGHV
jgi:hypothetical protein